MSALLERAGRAAAEIYEQRAAELGEDVRGHEITLRLLMTDAYCRGVLAGLDHARGALTDEIDVLREEVEAHSDEQPKTGPRGRS
jgi:hypothetical protein